MISHTSHLETKIIKNKAPIRFHHIMCHMNRDIVYFLNLKTACFENCAVRIVIFFKWIFGIKKDFQEILIG